MGEGWDWGESWPHSSPQYRGPCMVTFENFICGQYALVMHRFSFNKHISLNIANSPGREGTRENNYFDEHFSDLS